MGPCSSVPLLTLLQVSLAFPLLLLSSPPLSCHDFPLYPFRPCNILGSSVRALLWDLILGPSCILQVGHVHLHNLYIILLLGVLILEQHGKLFDYVVSTSFLFLFRSSNSLKSSSGSFSTSSHLGTKVPDGLDTELSPDGAHLS